MKAKQIFYWTVTILLSLLCVMGSFADITHQPDAIALITHLGYPVYFVSSIGTMRLLGVIAILIPGYPKIKEWAYAGLFFDMFGALYSAIANGDAISAWIAPLVAMLLVIGSYMLYRRRVSGSLTALQSSI